MAIINEVEKKNIYIYMKDGKGFGLEFIQLYTYTRVYMYIWRFTLL